MDTIYALASGVGAVAVFRVSGPRAAQVLSALSAPDAPSPVPRRAELRALRRPDDGAPLDQALCLWFPAPRSFTGEDVVEIHGHGGATGVAALAAAMEAAGARLARPGEFSRRAVLNGKIDLAQAEGLAAAIAAETEAERRHAQSVLRGAVGEAAARWRARLLRAAALCETQIDFIDEDVGADIDALAADELAALLRELREHAADVARADSCFGVPQIAIIGPPNAGKSSLLNRIAREDRAIVADRPGTTRDVLRARLNGPDGAFELIDTAGLRDAEDEVEAEGVRRAQAAAQAADLVVLAVSADTLPALWDLAPPPAADAVFWTKSDVAPTPPAALRAFAAERTLEITPVSARDDSPVRACLSLVARQRRDAPETLSPIAGSERRGRALEAATAAAAEAAQHARGGRPELAAAALRRAAEDLSSLIGDVSREDVLDEVFSRFCIGK